ncbi:hypothetical protein SO802_032119 [Lithocarpus litseifolius]|uniref:MULE transposase domain-containing protein n=1 Tax=Lithocarpus litseifolius TaxID=425828 RepID=A0AAW2BP81_9ROSI
MCVVGKDPNDEYFPFAYAVVEAETKDTWTWFLNLLLADIGDGKKWVFISDQQKAHSTTIWARHMFKSDGRSDTVLNNMYESFNSIIVKFRSKPIITMAGRTKFEVKNGLESFIVDFEEKKCSCRKWDIIGILVRTRELFRFPLDGVKFFSPRGSWCGHEATKDGAQPGSNDDVTTSAPPPPIDNQSNPRSKRQKKRSAVTTGTLNATGNAKRFGYASFVWLCSQLHFVARECIVSNFETFLFFLIGRMEIMMMSSLLFLLLGFNNVANSLLDFSSPMKSPFLEGRIIVVANSFQIHVGGIA